MIKYSEKVSSESYQHIWDEVIQKLIDHYRSSCLSFSICDNAYGLIWDNYVAFRKHCRESYMLYSDELLDRHKVCACLIYGIVKSSVIAEIVPKDRKKDYYSVINEDLALTTGLSLLRAFVESAIRNEESNVSTQKVLLKKIKNGFKYPETRHGTYRNNFLSELHYTKMEGNYNVLSLAHSLFLLEIYTMNCDK